MSRSGLILLVLVLAGGLSTLARQVSAQSTGIDMADYWRVVEVVGSVQIVQGPNPWNASVILVSGEAVGPYQSIATGADGRAILMRGQDVMVIYARTVVELPPPSGTVPEIMVLQRDGAVYYDIDPREVPDFGVATPYLLIGVKGTKFGLIDGGALLVVLEGLVEATDRAVGGSSDVAGGDAIGSGGAFVPRRADPSLLALFADMAAYVAANRSLWAGMMQEAALDEGLLLPGQGGGAGGGAGGAPGQQGGLGGTVGEATAGLSGATQGLGGAVGGAAEAVGGTVGDAADALDDALEDAAGVLGGLLEGP